MTKETQEDWRGFRDKVVPGLEYDEAMGCLRALSHGGSSDRETMLRLAERATEVARNPLERSWANRWLRPLAEGRLIRHKMFPITSVDGVPLDDEDNQNQGGSST